jgi:hypothetical protein
MTAIPAMPGQSNSCESSRPLFVLSVWRSGSSLLYSLLNQHSQIGLLYEGDLPHLNRYLRGHFQNGSWRQRWEFWNQGPSRHGIAVETLPAHVRDVWEATRIVYQEISRRKQAIIWGEKTPHWYHNPLQMANHFPDASFVFLWRDLNAVLGSIEDAARRERFFQKPGFTERVLLGSQNLREACDALKSQGRSVHEVNYEDLISKPLESMQQMCTFLGIPFEENTTSLSGADRSAIASGPHHSMVRGNRIVSQKKRVHMLPPKVKAKVNRYARLWRQRYNGKWPAYPLALPDSTPLPSFFELLRDKIFYQCFVSWDQLVSLIYSAVPIDFARSLRAWLRQRNQKRQLLPISR